MNNFQIVIDTNVVISALIFESSSSMKAFTLAKLRGTILLSNDVLSELINVLQQIRSNPLQVW